MLLSSSPFLSSPSPAPPRHLRRTFVMSSAPYDRTREVREFDESKLGVKGLVNSGITAVPRFFRHNDLDLSTTSPSSIPTVDLSLPRHLLIPIIHSAARDWGFFHVTNHGAPQSFISSLLSSVRAFNELPDHFKSPHYSRETAYGVNFNTNFDLHRSAVATWRDTIQILVSPSPPGVGEGTGGVPGTYEGLGGAARRRGCGESVGSAVRGVGVGGRGSGGDDSAGGEDHGVPLLPALPAARAHAGARGPHRPRCAHRAGAGRPRWGPAGEEAAGTGRGEVGRRRSCPRRDCHQYWGFSADTVQ